MRATLTALACACVTQGELDRVADQDQDGHWTDELIEGTDCDDGNPNVNPDVPERCGDGIDNDCDGAAEPQWFRDVDRDGFGIVDEVSFRCNGTTEGWAVQAGDCDDDAVIVFPGATERCDGIDNDCDGLTDEGCA